MIIQGGGPWIFLAGLIFGLISHIEKVLISLINTFLYHLGIKSPHEWGPVGLIRQMGFSALPISCPAFAESCRNRVSPWVMNLSDG
jgi:hypothetical protein